MTGEELPKYGSLWGPMWQAECDACGAMMDVWPTAEEARAQFAEHDCDDKWREDRARIAKERERLSKYGAPQGLIERNDAP